MRRFFLFSALSLALTRLFAQDVPTPAPAQKVPIILRNATVHIGDGTAARIADVLIENGTITQIGQVTATFKQANDYDCTGKHLYPGLITLNSTLGLQEIEAARATADVQEAGEINPSARALVAYNTDSRITPTVRTNGILIAQIAPRGGLFSGTSSVVQFDAWNYEDATIRADDGIYLNLPRLSSTNGDPEGNKSAQDKIDLLLNTLAEARAYANAEKPSYNATLASLAPLMRKEIRCYIRANTEKEILFAANLKNRYDIDIVIVGGAESYLHTEMLKTHQIPIVLVRTHRLPSREDEDVDLPYKLPALLHQAGVSFCFGMDVFWNERNLPFQAGTAVGYGLPYETAIQSLTLAPAQMLGIDKKYGSIAVGKSGTLLVCDGDLLDMRTSLISKAFIDGREIVLDNHHLELYRKFRQH